MNIEEMNSALPIEKEKEQKEVLVPIKAIVENRMRNSESFYTEDEIKLLRRYFISCLNLGYIRPNDLPTIVNKFTSRIKYISYDFKRKNKMDYYFIDNSVLYIYDVLIYENKKMFEINFFKAVTETVFQSNDKHIGISNAICEMTAEKIYNMDANGKSIIMPETTIENFNDNEIIVRSGYDNYILIISLLKQLFIAKKYNENLIIKDMFRDGYEQTIENLYENNKIEKDNSFSLLLDALDELCSMYIDRIECKIYDDNELIMLEKYQRLINKVYFNEESIEFYAFCALVTNENLCNEFMEKMQKKSEE